VRWPPATRGGLVTTVDIGHIGRHIPTPEGARSAKSTNGVAVSPQPTVGDPCSAVKARGTMRRGSSVEWMARQPPLHPTPHGSLSRPSLPPGGLVCRGLDPHHMMDSSPDCRSWGGPRTSRRLAGCVHCGSAKKHEHLLSGNFPGSPACSTNCHLMLTGLRERPRPDAPVDRRVALA